MLVFTLKPLKYERVITTSCVFSTIHAILYFLLVFPFLSLVSPISGLSHFPSLGLFRFPPLSFICPLIFLPFPALAPLPFPTFDVPVTLLYFSRFPSSRFSRFPPLSFLLPLMFLPFPAFVFPVTLQCFSRFPPLHLPVSCSCPFRSQPPFSRVFRFPVPSKQRPKPSNFQHYTANSPFLLLLLSLITYSRDGSFFLIF